METLLELFEERLQELSNTFLHLLSSLENNKLFVAPEVSKFRLEYLADIIKKTLENTQEKTICKLNKKVAELMNDTSEKKKKSLNSTAFTSNSIDASSKKSRASKLWEEYSSEEDVEETYSLTSIMTKSNSSSQLSKGSLSNFQCFNPKQQNQSKDSVESEFKKYNFKYLKLSQN